MNTTAKLSLMCVIAAFCSHAMGATEYVIANVNSPTTNRGNIYKLDTTMGTLTRIGSLATGGMGLGQGQLGFVSFTDIQEAITDDAACVFLMDAGSSDIASFSKSTSYSEVGDYSNSMLNSIPYGGSLALTPNGDFLYSSYSGTGDVAAWAVNSDCSLSFIAAYTPSASFPQLSPFGQFKITPDGHSLLVPITLPIFAVELFTIDEATGALIDEGFTSIPGCGSECTLGGLDITKDSRVAVLAASIVQGNQVVPFAISMAITPTQLGHPRDWIFNQGVVHNLDYNGSVFFDKQAFAGSGKLYFGTVGDDGNCGVITTEFTEMPLKIEESSTPVISTYDGAIAVTDNVMVIAEYPNKIGVYAINLDGSLSLLSATTVQNPQAAQVSVSLFPNTR